MGILGKNKRIAQELCYYAALCYSRNLVGAAGGNLSAKLPQKSSFIITPSGVSLRDIHVENLVVVNKEGDIIESPSGYKPSKESSLHLTIYGLRPDANAVIHVHPTYVIILSNMKRLIPTATISASIKLKQCALIPEAKPGSKTLYEYVSKSLRESPEDSTVLILERHGLVSYRSSLSAAFDDAELAEDTAKIAYFSDLVCSLRK